MYIRGIACIGILLLCIIAACSKASSDDAKTQDINTGMRESINAKIQEDHITEARESFNSEVREDINSETQEDINSRVQKGINAEVPKSLNAEGNVMKDGKSVAVHSGDGDFIENFASYPAGSLINAESLDEDELDSLFYSAEIDSEVKARIYGLSYGEDCSVPYEDLRYIRVLHKGFDDKTYIGELIVNKKIAEDIIDIFRELYNAGYPIERMMLIDEYNADDILSMEANNTSAFNFRYILGTTRLSNHSLGMAVDINPLYNPYVAFADGKELILPENGAGHIDRTGDCPYYIREGDACYEAFTSRGFIWGGEWKSLKDYQHFEKTVE